MDRLDAKAIKTYKEIILILDQCIDDYLFVMDHIFYLTTCYEKI